MQHQLYNILSSKRMESIKEDLKRNDMHHLAWLVSQQSEEAGKWLEVLPMYQRLIMLPNVFRNALRYRLFMRIEGMVDGLRCNCINKTVIDARGHHLATGCGVEVHRKNTHDAMVHELDEILRYCGKWTRREERGVFQLINPNDNKRPDISIINPSGTTTSKLLLDVAVTCPISGAQGGIHSTITHQQAIQPGRMAASMYNVKQRKYQQVVQQCRFSFKPIIFESTGYVHPETVNE